MAKDDFFEETPGKGGAKPKKGGKKAVKEPQQESASMSYTMNLYLAIALIVAAFVVGFVVRPAVLPQADSSIPAESTPTQQAPPLTQEQIQKGQMPAGHPQVTPPETSTPGETQTPSETPAPQGMP